MFFADCTFKSTKNLNHDILDLLDKPTIPGNCMFHQSNPHTEVILDYVPGVIIPENCRLANKIYTGSDFFDQ